MATPSLPVVADAVTPPPANAAPAPLVGAENLTTAPATGDPAASVAFAASLVAKAVPTVAV